MSFETFLSELSETNSTLDIFVDFYKVNKNVETIEVKLNQLNYLIGKDDLENAINSLFKENKQCFSILNIIIAVRNNRRVLADNGETVELCDYFETPEGVIDFVKKTGLREVFKNKKIKNLVDYVFGIEVGLDTNARKNRGGKNMENIIAGIFTSNEIEFRREVNSTEYDELKILGEDKKDFDFVIETQNKTYLIETNYYNSGGSKLNEVARSYANIGPKINECNNFAFVWITDGQGWLSAKNKLKEAYKNIPLVYNLKTVKTKFIELIKTP